MNHNPSSSCPLCGELESDYIDSFSFQKLRAVYQQGFSIDIEDCIAALPAADEIPLQRCKKCWLEFFPPKLAGNSNLYEKLARNDWYYGSEKWEFNEALPLLSAAQTVLEIGSGGGHFLDRLSTSSLRTAIGLELNSSAATECRNRGLAVESMPVEEFAAQPRYLNAFDAVCAFQVLEHVDSPRAFLEAALNCLKPGGLLLLSVPNSGDSFIRFAVNDVLNMPPHHVTLWNEKVFTKFAASRSLKISFLKKEPVAEYHRIWYQNTLLDRIFWRLTGSQVPRLALHRDFRFRVVGLATRVTSRLLPKKLWKYKKYPGHTLMIGLRKL